MKKILLIAVVGWALAIVAVNAGTIGLESTSGTVSKKATMSVFEKVAELRDAAGYVEYFLIRISPDMLRILEDIGTIGHAGNVLDLDGAKKFGPILVQNAGEEQVYVPADWIHGVKTEWVSIREYSLKNYPEPITVAFENPAFWKRSVVIATAVTNAPKSASVSRPVAEKVGEIKDSRGNAEYFVFRANIEGLKVLRETATIGQAGNVLDLLAVTNYPPILIHYGGDLKERLYTFKDDAMDLAEWLRKQPTNATFNVAIENPVFWDSVR